jgi:hypothetical protein
MNKLQAMAKIMALLGEDGNLKPGSREYAIARKLASKTIDQLGPLNAVNNVERRKASLLGQIYILKELEASGTRLPPLDL